MSVEQTVNTSDLPVTFSFPRLDVRKFAYWMAKQLMAAALISLLLPRPASMAETVVTATASIPFDFWWEGRMFPAGDYVLDSGYPGSVSIHSKQGKVSGGIPIVAYDGPVEKEQAKLIFIRRGGKYYVFELWSIRGKFVATAEFEHRGQTSDGQREVQLMYQ
jgi:hypothetical protein